MNRNQKKQRKNTEGAGGRKPKNGENILKELLTVVVYEIKDF